MVSNGIVWYGMVWYSIISMVWYGIVSNLLEAIIIHDGWLVLWNMNFMTFHILGMSSSQLTHSYFSEGLKPPSLVLGPVGVLRSFGIR